MRVGMVFPQREECGIAQFSRDLVAALTAAGVDITVIDSSEPVGRLLEKTAGCDVVHVQYETGFFARGRKDHFVPFMQRLTVPSVVSLHEVYATDPFVFPRENLSGNGLLLYLKRLLWDFRHPLQCMARRHRKNGYLATMVLVFHEYQKRILLESGVDISRINVLFNPVLGARSVRPFALPGLPLLHLGAAGFVNPAYDSDLLFETLAQLTHPWTFTWIGGAREAAGRAVFEALNSRIAACGWGDRFTITGWLPQREFDERLDALDIVLALFAQRSTSGSIARALGAGKPVIATRLPLTEELAGGCNGRKMSLEEPAGPLLLSERSAGAVVGWIERFAADEQLRKRLLGRIMECHEYHSLERYAQELVNLYREVRSG